MKFDRSLTTLLILPGIPAVLLLAFAVAAGNVRTALVPVLLAGACGAFCLSVMPQALQLLVRDRSYRNAINIAYVTVGALASLVTLSLFALVVFAIVRIAGSAGGF